MAPGVMAPGVIAPDVVAPRIIANVLARRWQRRNPLPGEQLLVGEGIAALLRSSRGDKNEAMTDGWLAAMRQSCR